MVDIESLTNLYFVNALPTPYNLKKGGEVLIKPILLRDAVVYDWAKNVLNLPKNETNDIEIIKMSYLDFILYISLAYQREDKNNPIHQIAQICKLCLGYEHLTFDKDKGRTCLLLCDADGNIEKVINSKEFDDIRLIILSQNDANYDNRYISPDVKELMEDYYKIKYADTVSPSLEKRKAFVSSKMGKTFQELNDLTYREFDLVYKSCVDSEIFIGQKIIQGSYKYDVKEDVKHPMFRKKEDPYEELFQSTDILKEKGLGEIKL